MSGVAAKATRRQLRRSIGDTALGAVIEQGARIGLMDDRLAAHESVLKTCATRIRAFHSLTFWQRLTWLVTGSIHGLS